MRKLLLMVALAFVGLIVGACPQQKAAEQASSAMTAVGAIRASEMIRTLALGQFDAATRDFSPPMKRDMPPPVLGQLWQSTITAHGPFLRQGEPVGELRSGTSFYRVPLSFERKVLEAQLSYDRTGMLTSFAIAEPGTTP